MVTPDLAADEAHLGTLGRMLAHRPRTALLAALACVGGLALTWLLAFTGPGRWLDDATLQGFTGLRSPRETEIAIPITHMGDPFPFMLLGLVLVLVAVLRHRPRVALVVVTILAGANLTTQFLKPALGQTRVSEWLGAGAQVSPGSWPSGHATAAMTLALCLVLVTAPRWRAFAALAGAAFAVANSFALLSLGWHYPSDVIGAYLVAALWTSLGVAVLWAAAARWPAHTGRAAVSRWSASPAVVPVAAAVACAALGGMLFAKRPDAVISYAHAHTTFMAGASAIAAIGTAIATALTVALRR